MTDDKFWAIYGHPIFEFSGRHFRNFGSPYNTNSAQNAASQYAKDHARCLELLKMRGKVASIQSDTPIRGPFNSAAEAKQACMVQPSEKPTYDTLCFRVVREDGETWEPISEIRRGTSGYIDFGRSSR